MFKVTPKGVLFLLSYFPGYRIHLYIPATHFFYGVYQQLHVGPKSGVGRGRGLSYTPCLLMKPALRLRLHATQSQSCFPAVSNALALSVGNRIFAATPTERITHYTLQAKSCAKGQAPLETPDNKTG